MIGPSVDGLVRVEELLPPGAVPFSSPMLPPGDRPAGEVTQPVPGNAPLVPSP